MPFDGPPWLNGEETQLVARWIADGARDAQGVPAAMPVGMEVRLEGILGDDWQLDDARLRIGPGTRLKKAPRPGDHVRVRGTVQADGGIAVTRLRRR